MLGSILTLLWTSTGHAATAPSVYKIANYPVQAQAADAVTAKSQALADGQLGAFRSLLKRIVPVTAYKRLPKLPLARIQDMIAGFSVRSESNSSTEYVATYDFEFQPRAVRELLRSSGIAFVEEAAPPLVLIPVYRAPAALAPVAVPGKAGGKGGTVPVATQPAGLPAHAQPAIGGPAWTKAWSDLDVQHALTPVKVAKAADKIADDTIRGLLAGDAGVLRSLTSEQQSDRVVLAYAEPSADGRKLNVTLIGRDAVGWLALTRSYPVLDTDIGYATELAAVVGLGILEGRWKAFKARGSGTGSISADGVDGWSTSAGGNRGDGIATSQPASSAGSDDVSLMVEFRGLGQWQQIRGRLANLSGVEDLEVGQMSARAAAVRLRYPGGPESLAQELDGQGLTLSNQAGQWVLQAR